MVGGFFAVSVFYRPELSPHRSLQMSPSYLRGYICGQTIFTSIVLFLSLTGAFFVCFFASGGGGDSGRQQQDDTGSGGSAEQTEFAFRLHLYKAKVLLLQEQVGASCNIIMREERRGAGDGDRTCACVASRVVQSLDACGQEKLLSH